MATGVAFADERPLAPEHFSYENCMSSFNTDDPDLQKDPNEVRSICNKMLMSEVVIVSKIIREAVNSSDQRICDNQQDLSLHLTELFQYLAQMTRSALSSNGITDDQLNISVDYTRHALNSLADFCKE